MNPDIDYSYYNGWHCYEIKKEKPTLSKLQEQMEDIENQIEQVRNLDVNYTIKTYALTELKEKKAEIRKAMHKCIDEMYS